MPRHSLTNSYSVRARTVTIRDFVLRNVAKHPKGIAALVMNEFGISRQAVNAHLKAMISDGVLEAKGRTRGREYHLVSRTLGGGTFPLKGLSEDDIWKDRIASVLSDLPKNVRGICHYGFTEMVNNVIDHSGSSDVTVAVSQSAATVDMYVKDDGVGIFNKIRDDLKLDDERQAMLELAKGKLTTDPERHTGEGIFFTSHMVDRLTILSGHFTYRAGAAETASMLETREDRPAGTSVHMEISRFIARTPQQVFEEFAGDDEAHGHAFARTLVPLRLARYEGEDLVSRSQAKRALARVENFRNVFLDFDEVDHIGPAFADEVFRVWQHAHPETTLACVNASAAVMRMVNRARRAAGLEPLHSSRV